MGKLSKSLAVCTNSLSFRPESQLFLLTRSGEIVATAQRWQQHSIKAHANNHQLAGAPK
jgi:hypothetical protein